MTAKFNYPVCQVVLSKAGPGLFFAAFGVLVVITSLRQPIKVGGDAVYQGMTEGVAPASQQSASQAATSGAAQEQLRVESSIQILNCMQRLSTTGSSALPASETDPAIRDAKLALLDSVWNVSEWGKFDSFKQWAVGSAATTTSPAKAIFNASRPGCWL